jgi:hypothetical protein
LVHFLHTHNPASATAVVALAPDAVVLHAATRARLLVMLDSLVEVGNQWELLLLDDVVVPPVLLEQEHQ